MERRLKVLWITNLAPPYRRALWRSLAPVLDLHVCLLATSEPNRHGWTVEPEGDFRLSVLRTVSIRHRDSVLYGLRRGELGRLGTSWDAVIVGGWESPAYVQALVWARRHGVPTVLHAASTKRSAAHTGRTVTRLKRRVHRMPTAFLSYGAAAEHNLRDVLHVDPQRIVRGFNGVDGHGIARDAEATRSELGATVDQGRGHRFIYAGQLIPRKNVPGLLLAAQRVLREGDTLDIVGAGPEEARIRHLIASAELQDRVTLTGPMAHGALVPHLATCHTLVLPSTEEVWGLVVNEALSGGLHVVASRACGAVDDLRGERRLYVADPEPLDLARAMQISKDDWTGWERPGSMQLLEIEYSAERALKAIRKAIGASPGLAS